MFRVEGELSYKRAKVDEIQFDQDFVDDYRDATGVDLSDADYDLDGTAKVKSAMVNAGGVALYAGGGIGRAWVDLLGDKDSAWAYEGIAGARVPVSNNIDLGLKYRHFRTALQFQDNANFTDADILLSNNRKFSSHSVLASLIFNFGAAAAAPPPPASAAYCDADLPGWDGNSGNGNVPGTAAAAGS